MDFAAALANLEKAADAVANNNNNNNSSRPRSNSSSSNPNFPPPRGGGGGGGYRGRRRQRSPDDHYNRRHHQHHQHHSYDRRDAAIGGGAAAGRGRYQRPRHEETFSHVEQQQQASSSLLEPMFRFGYRVAPYRGPPPPAAALEEPRRCFHIALLALTIDDLAYEHIWRAWAAQTTANNNILVSVVCHAKFPSKVTSAWLRQRLLVKPPRIGRGNSYADPEYHTQSPEWGSIQLTRAMLDCLTTAAKIGTETETTDETITDPRFSSKRFLMDQQPGGGNNDEKPQPVETTVIPPVDTFIFISETCLPVRTLEECAKEIYGNHNVSPVNPVAAEDATSPSLSTEQQHRIHQSWVKARNNRTTPGTPHNKYERDQFSDIHRMVPHAFRWKADQWLLLSRSHALAVLNVDAHMSMRSSDQLWNSFAKISASDEMYFPTVLGILGILKDDEEEESKEQMIQRRQVTYVDWSEGMRNPATYDKGVRDFARVARLARENGSLFARKFVPYLPVPGKEIVITGAITVDEWKEQVAKLIEMDAAAATKKTAASSEDVTSSNTAKMEPDSMDDGAE